MILMKMILMIPFCGNGNLTYDTATLSGIDGVFCDDI